MGLFRVVVAFPPPWTFHQRTARGGQKGLHEAVAERLGGTALLVTQDPTDERLFSLVVRFTRSPPHVGYTDGVLTVQSVEAVEEPPHSRARHLLSALSPLASYGLTSGPWDAGLTEDEIRTVQDALSRETDPRHLTGLASTLEPWFPVAASLLRLRSAALEPGAEYRTLQGKPCPSSELDQALQTYRRYASSLPALDEETLRLEVKRAATVIVQQSPFLTDRAPLSGFPDPIAALAWCLVRVVATRRAGPEGGREVLRMVDGARVRQAFPPTGEEGFVSPSALQLAMATMKPKVAGVAQPERVMTLFDQIDAGGGQRLEEALAANKARASMEKAQRTLERQRWVEWYARSPT